MNKQQELRMKLDFLIPMNWMRDFSNQNGDKIDILSNVVELNPKWVEEVVNNLEYKLTDVLHDFRGIYSEDEHFLPRISTEDILGDFDENGDAVDVKVNGYTNIETYRLCLVLDNTEYWKEDILQTFFRLVREDEFSANDINIIDWNEVIKRYSDDLIETHIHHHNE